MRSAFIVSLLTLGVIMSVASAVRADEATSTEIVPAPALEVVETFGLEDFDDDLAVIVGQQIKLRETILFHFAKVSIRQESYATLDRVADLLKSTPEIEGVSIEGHTDAIGKPGFNRELSRARAQAVVEYLVSRGVPAERLSWQGHGETLPIASNKTKAGMQANRRVEFLLRGAEGLDESSREPAVAGLVHLAGAAWRWTSASERVSLKRWASLSQGAALETDAGSWLALRFQDLGRLVMGPASRVKLVRLEWDAETGVRRLGAKLVAGRIELSDREGSSAVVLSQEGSLELTGADALIERRGGALSVALYEGSATFSASEQRLTLAQGHAWRYERQSGAVDLGPLPEAPRHLSPIEGELTADTKLTWEGEAASYLVEVARDAQFVERIVSVEVSRASFVSGELAGVEAGESVYVRVRAMGAGALPGAPGEVRGYAWQPSSE